MGETADQSTVCTWGGTDRDGAGSCVPQQLLEALTDETARRIYLSLEEPATVAEIIEQCDVAESTAYRKITELDEAGLILRFEHRAGGVATQYVQAMDQVVVTYDDPIQIECVVQGFSMHCELEPED
ncbi:winged helix-turn-helix domain-containing protein [Natronolimnobius baerhuensis]|uniref:Transcriptional regulator n=1 Tax=Natronolimnobius baerhuensis TaxID=253108 RepID=A0A202E6K6_9EURY|nr:helix-turn-helix domain-containing protein [Natronolimnobius baerhuensis]OVE83893.1 transcriptional regulator [Natronolimnobius baerhuensis]